MHRERLFWWYDSRTSDYLCSGPFANAYVGTSVSLSVSISLRPNGVGFAFAIRGADSMLIRGWMPKSQVT